MSRSHHNAYSQQQHHHTHQNSWFMSPNIVNSLFCSPGNNSSANCNNTFINGSNINNHLTNLLNAQHHFIPPNQISNSQSHANSSQSSMIGGSAFSSHYHSGHQNFSSQPYSSIFPFNNAYTNSSTGSSNRFIAGQNNHHYQNSSNYSRSMHSSRTSKANINFNSINSETNHSRRYQPSCNTNGPLLTFPGSMSNGKSLNVTSDFNIMNDNSARSLSSNPSFYQNKDCKSPNNNNNYTGNAKYNSWSKISNNEPDGIISNSSLSASDLHQNSKITSKSQYVKGMENIKLDNEGVHSNYIQFNGMISKPSNVISNNYELSSDNKSKDSLGSSKENAEKLNNYTKNGINQPSSEFSNYQPLMNSETNNNTSDNLKSMKVQSSKKIDLDSLDNQKKSSVKLLLNVDEDELLFYDDDIAEVTRFDSESNAKLLTLVDEKKYISENCFKSIETIDKLNPERKDKLNFNVDELEKESGPDGNKKKLTNKSSNQVNNQTDLVNSMSNHGTGNGGSISSTTCSSLDFSNSEANFNSHHQSSMLNSYPQNNSHFATPSLVPTMTPTNMSPYSPQMTPNFAINCPLLSNPNNNMMTAVYIAASLGGNHTSPLYNQNSKCNIFRPENLKINSNSYHDIVSSKLWQFYVTNRQTEAMYVRKVQLRNALHMVMSYVFENAGLFIVGSSMNGFGNDHSDMDLCLTITSKELHQKKEAFVVLNQLVEPLRKCSFIKNLQLIRATVPILKFRDALAGVDCDLNINNVVGIYNTHLLAMYNRIDWRVRPLGMYIKHWAQKLDLHDASRGRLSTYTLILMIIQYLQSGCQPPILPSLQAKFAKHFSYDRQVKEVDMRLELPWEELRSTNTTRLSDLLLGFFEYYVEKFDFSRMAVSIRTGKPIPIEMAIKQLPPHEQLHNVKSFKMFIEEPFSLTNVARSLFDGLVFSRIKRCFRHSLQVLRMKQSLKCMFSLPSLSNSSATNVTSNSENPDQNRLITNSSPTTSTSTQDENSKIVPVLDIIENDNSEKSDFKDDGSYSDDNKSLEKNITSQCDFEEDDTSISGINS